MLFSRPRHPETKGFFAALPLAATQLRQDVLREAFPDLAMARDRLVNTRLGIAVPVMPSPVPHQLAAALFDLFQQRDSFHATAISPTLRIPGNSPLVRSL